MTNSNSLLGLVGNTNYEFDEFESYTAYLFSQHNENLANGLYEDTISVETPPATNTEETPSNIQNIGIFNGNNSISLVDGIEANSHPDVYQFNIDRPNNFTITLDDLSADADFYLFDGNGAEIAVSNNYELEAETLSETLDAGTYSLGIVSYDGMDTEYSLSIQTGEFASATETDPTAAPAPIALGDPIISPDLIASEDPGETLDLALDFGAFDGDGMLSHSEGVGASDSTDLYRFSISQSNDFNFVLEGMSADADLHLVDINGEILAASENYNTDAEILIGSLPAGTYFLGVDSYDGIDTDYNLHAVGGENALSLAEINEVVAPGLATEFAFI